MEKNFIEFTKRIIQKLQEKLSGRHQIEMKESIGINGTVKHSLLLIHKDKDIHPCINLDAYYNQYKSGKGLNELVNGILEKCREDSPVSLSAISNFTDGENVKPYIYAKLINTQRNYSLLQKIPNRAYLDLSLIYYVRMESLFNEEYAVIQVSNEQMRYWGIHEDMLYQSAWENILRSNEVILESIEDILSSFCYMEEITDSEKDIQMYVLSNRNHLNGAVQMCNMNALRELAEMLGDDLWVLPSSVHEVILVPVCQTAECAKGLAEIVKEMNDIQLEPHEILSYHVYRYSRKSGKLSISA